MLRIKGWVVESYVVAGGWIFFWFAKASYQFWNKISLWGPLWRETWLRQANMASSHLIFASICAIVLTILRAKPVFTAPFAFCNGSFAQNADGEWMLFVRLMPGEFQYIWEIPLFARSAGISEALRGVSYIRWFEAEIGNF